MGAARREILAGLAAGGVASRAAAQEGTMIVPLPIPWDPEGLADLAACRTDAFSRLATLIVSPAIGKMAALRTGSETILGILNQWVGSLSG
jgi:hypothetical protein